MARSKRTTVKTGPYSKRTTTISSSGTRVTNSNKPPGAFTRRTSSVNLRTGKTRVTHSKSLGGGWRDVTSKTFGGSTQRKSSGRRTKKSSGDGDFIEMIFLLIVAFFTSFFSLFSDDNKQEEKKLDENTETLLEYVSELSESQIQILMHDTVGFWVNENNITEKQKDIIFNYDWKNFEFDKWKKENGFD